MRHEDLARLAMDNQDIVCYISDLETYDVLYANQAARTLFMSPPDATFVGKKCYDLIHRKNAPCENCNNALLTPDRKLSRVLQCETTGKYYSFVNSLVDVDGKYARLTILSDTTVQKEQFEALTQKLLLEETLVKCIHTLFDEGELADSIANLLAIVGEYYKSDRAYIFEFDAINNVAHNIFEWSSSEELASIHDNPTIVLDELKPILEKFSVDGEVIISDIHMELDHSSDLYKFLDKTDSQSVLMVPLFEQGKITSFMGVDNPRRMVNDLALLHSVKIFVADDMKKDKVLKRLEHLSYNDALTGLYNRNKYIALLEEVNTRALSSLGFIHVTINGLKKANELYGEEHGDYILKRISAILAENIDGDLFRLSGDEFIALCQNIAEVDFTVLLASLRNIEKNIEEFSFAVGGVWQGKNINIRQGIAHATEIMYAEKQNYYKKKGDVAVQSRTNPTGILLDEIKNGEFFIFLQPKVYLTTGLIVGAEALVRKHGRDGKLVSPDRFIPIYENEGTIRHLDFFVLEEVCKVLKTLIKKQRPVKIAVNFSRVTFIAYDVVEEVVLTCKKYNIPHEYIAIEITESIDKMDFEFFNNKLNSLKEVGFHVSLDDFGAKHSNLLMLTTNEFDEVKIDKGLIDNIVTSSQNRTLVRNIIKTIKELGTSNCLAEGIEDKEQKDMLQDFGCAYGQGYYFYRPMPVNDFINCLKTNKNIQNEEFLPIGKSCLEDFKISGDELFAIIEAMPLCANLWNHKRENIMCNRLAVELFELDSREQYCKEFFKLSPERQPDGRLSSEAAMQYINDARNNGSVVFNWMHCKLDGEEIPSEITLTQLDVKGSEGDYLIAGFTRDLRSQLAGNYDVANDTGFFFNQITDKALFTTIAELSAEWFWVYDHRLGQIQFFGKGCEILGLSTQKQNFPNYVVESGIVYEDDYDEFMAFYYAMEKGATRPTEVRFILPDQSIRHYKIKYKMITDAHNRPLFAIGKTYDIEDQKSLTKLSQIDLLTNCYNKMTTENLVQTHINQHLNTGHALFIVDIDNFKTINDTLGHHVGDLILVEVSKCLHYCFRDGDIIGRIGGDEFVAFVKNSNSLDVIIRKAEAITQAFRNIFLGEVNNCKISASVGIAICPQDGRSYKELYLAADKALYVSKKNGRDCYTVYEA